MITQRIESIRQNYVNAKPALSCERAYLWTESHKKTEGLPVCIRRARAFYDCCDQLTVHIFDGELVVGAIGEHRKCGILTPEFSWLWVDREMDTFSSRPQDPYEMTDEQRKFMREKVFPYWKGKSLEEAFLSRLPEDTKKIGVDTGVIDSDSKWRQAVGEITPDYQDVLFKKGFGGLIKQAEEKIAELDMANAEDEEKRDFYESTLWTSRGIIRYANRYADEAERMAGEEKDPQRAAELRRIAANCRNVPENPPANFYEAIQFLWFVQIGAILSENPLALNPGRFDQYMDPYYEADLAKGEITEDFALELIEALWLKYSEWVWTISSNTADYFAGYNQFQNLTVGGRKRDGKDATNPVSYMALKATEEVKSHQPGLSVRIHADCPKEFLDAVTHLVSKGTGFPAIHSDSVGYQMLINLGYEPDDARDWNNCGCVVPHFRKTGEWTSAANLNFGSALEYALNEGRSLMTGEKMGLDEKPAAEFTSYEEVEAAFFRQFDNLCRHAVISLLTAQRLHKEMVPRPFLSSCNEHCMEVGKDETLAKYSGVPVWNGLTDEDHPTQVLADFLTAHEVLKKPYEDIKFAFVGDGQDNVSNALMLGAAVMGMEYHVVTPKELNPTKEVLDKANAIAAETGAKIVVSNDVKEGVKGMDVIYADVWVSMGESDDMWEKRIKLLKPYQVTKEVMDATENPKAIFEHCLPAFHNLDTEVGKEIYKKFGLKEMEVTDEVFESKNSVVFREAENRMHTIKAVMVATLGEHN